MRLLVKLLLGLMPKGGAGSIRGLQSCDLFSGLKSNIFVLSALWACESSDQIVIIFLFPCHISSPIRKSSE